MPGQWNPEVFNKHIGPGFSDFCRAEIPDEEARIPQGDYWTRNYFLNTIFGPDFNSEWRPRVFGFLRRSQQTFVACCDARKQTLAYLQGLDPNLPKLDLYFSAIGAWERFLLHSNIAMDCFVKINLGTKIFREKDSSAEQRLYNMGNVVKHGHGRRREGREQERFDLPIMLSNEGLRSFDSTQVTYAEAFQFLTEIGALADELQNPHEFRNNSLKQRNNQ